jgi:hypothetical protein
LGACCFLALFMIDALFIERFFPDWQHCFDVRISSLLIIM